MDTGALINALPTQISLVIVIVCLALGYVIKHTPALDKVSNSWIPIILLVVGILMALIDGGSVETIITKGIISGAVAIALHQTGRNIFELISSSSSVEQGGTPLSNISTETDEQPISKSANVQSETNPFSDPVSSGIGGNDPPNEEDIS